MLRKRTEEYIKIDKDNPNKAVYFEDQLHKTGRIHSEYINKIWRYSFNGKVIKKQRCYIFRERKINGFETYKFSLVKTHASNSITDTLDPFQYQLLLKSIERDNDDLGLINYTSGVVYFSYNGNDNYVYNVYYKKLYDDEEKARKRLENIINKKENLCVMQTWSLKGIGEDYKFSDDEDEWVKWV